MTEAELKREVARHHKGVWYDPRADKFAAEVYSRGERHFLGTFDTVQEAADAYAKARADLPSGRDNSNSFSGRFEAFLADVDRDDKNAPVIGSVLTYDGQDFIFDGVVFRTSRDGGKRPFYQWRAQCRTCDAEYRPLTSTSPSAAKGITRNCEDHRATRGRRKADNLKPTEEQTDYWLDLIYRASRDMSLAVDSISVPAFIAHCRSMARSEGNGLPAAFETYLRDDGAALLNMQGSEIIF